MDERIRKANYVIRHLNDLPEDVRIPMQGMYESFLKTCEVVYDKAICKGNVTVNDNDELEIWLGGTH